MSASTLIPIAFASFLVAAVTAPIAFVALRRRRVLDHPNDRSSHGTATVRGGGLIVAAGAVAGLAAAPGPRAPLLPLALAASACGVIGLADDIRDLPAGPRFVGQTLTAFAAVWAVVGSGPRPFLWLFLGVIGLVGFVNAFNFMDGINGLAGGEAVASGVVFAILGLREGDLRLAAGGAALAAATAVFIPMNFPSAKVFLGDVGSYFIGAWLAMLVVIALRIGLPFEAAVAPVALFVVDSGGTLVSRIHRRQRWHEAHREHVYQRITPLERHWPTTLAITLTTAVIAALGAVSLGASTDLRILADVAVLAILVLYLLSPRLLKAPGLARRIEQA